MKVHFHPARRLPENSMPTEVAFDTLKMVERFQSAGFSAEQAKMTATVLAEVIGAEDARIADRFSTKQDVALELAGIRSDIDALRHEMKTMIADTKADLVRWVVGVGLLQMALITGLVLKLAH
jgi:hypothetical protein